MDYVERRNMEKHQRRICKRDKREDEERVKDKEKSINIRRGKAGKKGEYIL